MRNVALLAFLVLLLAGLVGVSPVFGQNENLTVTVEGDPHCNDGIDNDGDGLTDYPADPGCSSLSDENEIDPPPSGGGGGGSQNRNTVTVKSSSDQEDLKAEETLEIEVPNSAIFKGRGYQNRPVILIKDGVIVAETKAGPNGNFEIRVSDLTPGTYNFGLIASDNNEEKSVMRTISVVIEQGTTAVISGIFLPPTIFADKQEVQYGHKVSLFGQAVPESFVLLSIHSEVGILKSLVSDSEGLWSFDLNSVELGYGNHLAKARNLKDLDSSPSSKSIAFTVGSKDILHPQSDLTQSGFDIDGDGRVNLVDFSIAAYWYKKANPRKGDLNSDGIVDLTDMSIMAYHWTG